MKKFRGDGNVTFTRDSLRDVADVGIDAEGFLEDEHSGNEPFSSAGDECFIELPSATANVCFSVVIFGILFLSTAVAGRSISQTIV